MTTINETIEPEFKAAERQELSHLDYFRRKIEELRDRGLITGDSFETIDSEIQIRRQAIDRHGLYRAKLGRARKLLASRNLAGAREWAALARLTAPEQREAWELELSVCGSLGRHDDVIALCSEAVERFPDLAVTLGQLRGEKLRRDAEQKRLADLARERSPRVPRKEQISIRKEPEPVLAGDGAVASNLSDDNTIAPEVLSAKHEPSQPELTWSSVAGEFLQVHWQKLILCMAVLLIVVSSTVGAHLLLGERLWSPVGKCSLAMVATLMFAALGMVLVRWGAERAGQMMLVTTLIVVPIHFMLAGELRLVLEPSVPRLIGFAIQVAALLALSRAVGGMLVPGKDAWYLTVPLILMSVFNATMARRVAGPWEWQFAAFQAPALVFLCAVLGLKFRTWEPSALASRWFGNLLLGLLGFALMTSLVRTGVYALEVPAALYAVPVMLIALACVHGARWISAYEPDPRQVALMKLGGHILAGLAFAMALARPPATSALFSGNTLAVAVLGLLLFGGSLRGERQPAYLYLGFAAVFLGYFGAYGFLRDLLLPIEGPARQALLWAGRLPGPYRAINGLMLNLLLGILALAISRRWKDERLVRHCHYLGVALSVAACAYSGFEPRAAVICLSGYTVLDLLATRVFRSPRVQYLAIASLAGAAYFGSTLMPAITLDQQALGAALIGFCCALVPFLLRGCRSPESFRLPWTHAALILSGVAQVAATIAMLQVGATSFLGGWSFLVVSLTAAAVNLDRRETALGYLALVCANVAAGLALVSSDVAWHWAVGLDRYAIVAGLTGLAEICLGTWSGPGRNDENPADRISDCYAWPLRHLGLVLASIAVAIAACVPMPLERLDAIRLINVAIALGASSSTFAIASIAIYRVEWLAHVTVWTGLAGYFCGVLGVLARAGVPHVGPTVLIALSAASLLLFEIWNRLRLAYFCRPLLYGSLALVVTVMPIAFLLWHPGLHIGVALALAGLALVAILGDMPRRKLVYLALVAFFGVWLKGLALALDLKVPTSTLWFGLALGLYDLLLLGIVEIIRAGSSEEGQEPSLIPAVVDRSRARMFAALIPSFVIAAGFLADAMAWMNLEAFRWSGLILLLAAFGLLWASRFVRDSVLMYAGLWHAVGAVSCLSRSLYTGNGDALLVGWMALTLALAALALWLASLAARRCRLDDIYWVPSLNTALGLTGVIFVMAVAARVMARDAFKLCAAALVLDALVCLLIATTRRWSLLIHATVACFVSASYVILLSVGEPDPNKAYVLGLNAVVHGLVVWVLGDVCRRIKNPWPQACARPLFHSALILTVMAVPPAFRSPVTMGLVAVSFLLTVKSLPGAEWIYPALAAIGAALYFPWLSHLSLVERITACLVLAYALWMLGLLVRRDKSLIADRLGLRRLNYELPLFNLAAVVGLAAFLLNFDGGLEHGMQWTARAWVPLILAPLALGMIRVHPRPEFVHASLGLLTWGIISVFAPSLSDPHFLVLALVICSLGLQVTDLVIRPGEQSLCDRLAIQGVSFGATLRAWWFFLGLFGIILGSSLVMVAMAKASGHATELGLATSAIDWWAITASIVLVATQIVLAGLDSDLLEVMRPEGLIVGVELTGVVLLWWLGVAGSPLGMWNMQPGVYYPLATALAALVIAEWNSRLGQSENLAEAAEQGRSLSASMVLLSSPVLVLSLLAPAFTYDRESTTTVATFGLVAMALGLWAVRWEQVWAAYLAGLAWSAAGLAGGLVVGHHWSWIATEPRLLSAAIGELVAVYTLGGLGGWFRQIAASQERGKPLWASGSIAIPRHLALALEQVAFVGSLIVGGLVALAASRPAMAVSVSGLASSSIGTLLALCLFYLLLTHRWNAEWLVFLAQACLVAAYVEYRRQYPLSADADAMVLVLFAFVDMGIAEVMERLQLPLYARPTRYASLVLPVLPLVRLLAVGGLNDTTVFHLLAAGTFYAVACGTMQWKTLGYAAGVLYNAALWGTMGWELADHPQFYFVPVGLSAILFAESNRRDLGRQTVNSIRSAGLITTYLALAAPIWQFRSFGDWVALLLGSLLGLFAGIGLRVQTFVWLGLVTFLADVLYELGRVSLDHALAKWAIMLSLGILLVFFVALNEKKQVVAVMRDCFEEVRTWE